MTLGGLESLHGPCYNDLYYSKYVNRRSVYIMQLVSDRLTVSAFVALRMIFCKCDYCCYCYY